MKNPRSIFSSIGTFFILAIPFFVNTPNLDASDKEDVKSVAALLLSSDWRDITDGLKAPSHYSSKEECSQSYWSAAIALQELALKLPNEYIKNEIHRQTLSFLQVAVGESTINQYEQLEAFVRNFAQDLSLNVELRYKAAQLREHILIQKKTLEYQQHVVRLNSLSFDQKSTKYSLAPSDSTIIGEIPRKIRNSWDLEAAKRLNAQFPQEPNTYEHLIGLFDELNDFQKNEIFAQWLHIPQALPEFRQLASKTIDISSNSLVSKNVQNEGMNLTDSQFQLMAIATSALPQPSEDYIIINAPSEVTIGNAIPISIDIQSPQGRWGFDFNFDLYMENEAMDFIFYDEIRALKSGVLNFRVVARFYGYFDRETHDYIYFDNVMFVERSFSVNVVDDDLPVVGTIENSHHILSGWAASLNSSDPVEKILVYFHSLCGDIQARANEEGSVEANYGEERQDISTQHNRPDFLYSGWSLSITDSDRYLDSGNYIATVVAYNQAGESKIIGSQVVTIKDREIHVSLAESLDSITYGESLNLSLQIITDNAHITDIYGAYYDWNGYEFCDVEGILKEVLTLENTYTFTSTMSLHEVLPNSIITTDTLNQNYRGYWTLDFWLADEYGTEGSFFKDFLIYPASLQGVFSNKIITCNTPLDNSILSGHFVNTVNETMTVNNDIHYLLVEGGEVIEVLEVGMILHPGEHTILVLYHPTDESNYRNASATMSITVLDDPNRDDNQNGIPDWWEHQWFNGPINANDIGFPSDEGGDGLSHKMKYLLGFDPTQAAQQAGSGGETAIGLTIHTPANNP